MSKDSYKAFGRGTPAGNAVYNLYNGKKNMDSTLDPELLARLQKMRKEKEEAERNTVKPKVTPKSQAYVNVPKPTNGRKPPSAEQVAEWRLQALGRRKRLDEILADPNNPVNSGLRDYPESYNQRGPARTDADKAKFQQIMEHGEVLPPIQKLPKELQNKINRQKTRRTILTEEFDHLSSLISEKRAMLKDVQRRQAVLVSAKIIVETGGGGGGGGDDAPPAPVVPVSNSAIAALRSEETELLREIGQLVSDMKSVDAELCAIPESED